MNDSRTVSKCGLVSRVSDRKVVTCCKRRDIFEMATIKVKGRFEQNIFSCVKLKKKKKKCQKKIA